MGDDFTVGKHSRQSNSALKRTAQVSVLSFSATAAFATAAQAAEVQVPNTDIKFRIDGLENVPNIAAVPGITDWVPSLEGQASNANFAAIAEVPAQELPSEGQRIVDLAATKIGSPYQWGATGPNAFDCSGLTTWAYAQVGKHIPRTSYAQAAQGTRVAYQDLKAGDIVAFYSGATHVGIYTGHGTVINAVDYGTPLSETPMNHMPFHSAVRY